jgi:hypothetical protein
VTLTSNAASLSKSQSQLLKWLVWHWHWSYSSYFSRMNQSVNGIHYFVFWDCWMYCLVHIQLCFSVSGVFFLQLLVTLAQQFPRLGMVCLPITHTALTSCNWITSSCDIGLIDNLTFMEYYRMSLNTCSCFTLPSKACSKPPRLLLTSIAKYSHLPELVR